MYIAIVTGVQNETDKSPKRQCFFVKKKFFLKLLFCDEGHLYANCLFNILTVYPKCYGFHFFSRGIGMYIPILTGFQNEPECHRKDSVFFAKKYSF